MPNQRFHLAETRILERLKNELPTNLYYHGYHHTLDVLEAAMVVATAENVSDEDIRLLRIAVCYHDAGFIYVYKGHEVKSCEMVREYLPALKFTEKEMDSICSMIMATRIPQEPQNLLGQIIADADLDYLGRDDVFEIADTLKQELKEFIDLHDEKIWIQMQISFLKSHRYHTLFSIENRRPKKVAYLKLLEEKLH